MFGYLAVEKDLILVQLSEEPIWTRQVSGCYPWKKNILWVGERLSGFLKALVGNDSTHVRDYKCGSRLCLRHSGGPQLQMCVSQLNTSIQIGAVNQKYI